MVFTKHQLKLEHIGRTAFRIKLHIWFIMLSKAQPERVRLDTPIQSTLFMSMRRDRHPHTYKAFIFVRRVDLSHTNLVRTRAGILVGGLCLYAVCL